MDGNNHVICRLCGRNTPILELIDILESDVLVKIRKLLPVVVVVGDPLPQEICKGCKSNLDSFSEFYDMTVEVATKLRSTLRFVTPETTSVSDCLVKYSDLADHFGPSFKHYLIPKNDENESAGDCVFVKTINNTKLFSCRACKRTWVSTTNKAPNNDPKPSQEVEEKAKTTAPTVHLKTKESLHEQDFLPTAAKKVKLKLEEKCNSNSSGSNSSGVNNNLETFPPIKNFNPTAEETHQSVNVFQSKEKKEFKSPRKIKRYTCEFCGKHFRYKAKLRLHTTTSHINWTDVSEVTKGGPELHQLGTKESLGDPSPQKHTYGCGFCELSFSRKSSQLSHIRTHTEYEFDDLYLSDDAL